LSSLPADLLTTPHRSWEAHKYSQLALPALLGLIVLLCVARAYAGFYGVLYYPHDVFSLLDPAWRILNGQKPNLDFSSQLGPFPYLQTALGLVLSHYEVQGMIYGQALAGFCLAIWTCLISIGKVTFPFRHLLSLYVLLLAIAPYNIGESFTFVSAAMTYNRLSYALTILVLVESLGKDQPDENTTGWLGGISTGIALALLLFSKITFFLGAVFLVISLAVVFRKQRNRWIGMTAGFGVVTLAFLSYLRFDVSAILRDYQSAAASKHIGPTKILSAALNLGSAEGLTLVAFVFLYGVNFWNRDSRAMIWRQAAAGVCVLLAGSFLLFGNFQPQGLPLNLAFLLFLAGSLPSPTARSDQERTPLRIGLKVWATLLAVGAILVDISSVSYAVFERAAGHIPPMKSAGLNQFRIRDAGYADFVDDGISLANQYRRPEDTIISLDFSDFFGYALRIRPSRTGVWCLHFGSTFSDRSHPDPEWLLGPASIVMVPVTFSENGSQLSIPRIYGPYLDSHFQLEGSSKRWKLYRRK